MAVIGISGSYGGLNLGDEAILASILALWRTQRPDDKLVVFARNGDHTADQHDADAVVVTRDVSRDGVVPEIERLDLLVLGGGGILYDEEARAYLRDVRLAQERGIPTFAYAVGAGPLKNPEDRQLVAETLTRMDGVTVRDEGAKRVLEEVGIDRPIEVTGDPALLLAPEPFTDDMLRTEGIDRQGPLVGLSVREPGSAAPGLETDDYHSLLAEAADFIVHRYEASVVFVPMERGDIRHSHGVISRMLAADRAQVLKGDYNPRQVLGLMQHFSFVVGMRLHFLIFAATSAVPFLPLPYAGKVSDFVAAAGVPAPPGVTRESAGPLLAEIDKLWDARDAHRQHLARTVPGLQEHARRTGHLAAELLSQR